MRSFVFACYGDNQVQLLDEDGNVMNTAQGALNVHIADIHTQAINQKFHKHTGDESTLNAIASVGDRTIELVSATGFTADKHIQIELGTDILIQYKIISISVNTLTLDGLIDVELPVGTLIEEIEVNMIDAASAGSEAIYIVEPPADETWHLLRILLTMTHPSAGDLGKFGGIAAITNGVALRVRIAGVYQTYSIWKTNEDIKLNFYDLDFDSRSGGGGAFGTSSRGTFSKAGVAIKLDGATGDKMEIILQDDMSGLTTFSINAQGHKDIY